MLRIKSIGNKDADETNGKHANDSGQPMKLNSRNFHREIIDGAKLVKANLFKQ